MLKTYRNILAIDYGLSRIGLAKKFDNIDTIIPLQQINNDPKSVQNITKLIQDENIGLIFIGDPLNLDGTKSQMCEKVERFTNALKSQNQEAKILMVDERFTTSEINKRQSNIGLTPKQSRNSTDSLSATIILEKGIQNIKNNNIQAK